MIMRPVLLLLLVLSVHGKEVTKGFSYLLLPMNMTYAGSYAQYFHIFITSWDDTDIEITVPDTTQGGVYYRQHVSLSRTNNWSWRGVFLLSDVLLTKAVSRGFRLTSSQPVIVYALRYTSYIYGYLTAYQALTLTSEDTSFSLGTYYGRVKQTGYGQFYVICSWETPVNYTVYNTSTGGVPQSVKVVSMEPYQTDVQMTNAAGGAYIGLTVNSSDPVSVFVGNQRNAVPSSATHFKELQYAKPLFQQSPPVARLGKLYVIGPVPGGAGHTAKYSVLVTFPFNNTDVVIWHDPDYGDVLSVAKSPDPCALIRFRGRTVVKCRVLFVELENSRSELPLLLSCSRPCSPSLLKHTDTTGQQETSGYMSVMAPPSRIPLPLRIFLPGQLETDQLHDGYVIIATKGERRDASLDGVFLDKYSAIGSCNVSYVNKWSVTCCRLPYGVHVIDSLDRDVLMSVHIHGYALKQECSKCYSSSYGFPAYYPGDVNKGLRMTDGSSNDKINKYDTSSTCYGSQGSALDGVTLACVILLTVLTCGFMFLTLKLSRDFYSSRRKSLMPDPDTPDHLYLCPSPNSCQNDNYNYSKAGCSAAGNNRNSTKEDEDTVYCDV